MTEVRDAIETFAAGPADFADCEAVATFDRGMKALPAVRLL